MNRKLNGIISLALIAVIVGAVNFTLSTLPLRTDMTEEKLYTLSDGSKAVLGNLESEVTLKFYFSESSKEIPMSVKTYAKQVGDLLSEYSRASKGMLVLEQYDPKPDSDSEEWAQRYGVEPQMAASEQVYFGLVAVCGDREEVLPCLSMRTATTLEYDVTRLVTRVAWPERPVIGIVSGIADILAGEMNPMMMQTGQRPAPGWAAFNELQKDYEVKTIGPDADTIDSDVKTLIVFHPKNISDKMLAAIDRFVVGGGRLIACIDPFSVVDMLASRQRQNPMMMQQSPAQDGPSTLGPLFDAWGIKYDMTKVIIDMAAATPMNNSESNPAFLSLDSANVNKEDLLVSELTDIMIPFAGALSFEQKEGLVFEPLLETSKENTCLVDGETLKMGMNAIRPQINPDGVRRVMAARLSGTFKTAFPEATSTNAPAGTVAQGTGTVVIFADSDFLADNFCVQILNTPFGAIAQPRNDNLTLFMNVIEQLAGRQELIGLRSRAKFNRPFVKVDELEAKAAAKWQKEQTRLEQALAETQQRLYALQQQKNGNERLILSKEQQDEIDRFRKMQRDTSRQLKNVRRELTSEIDSLGLWLKMINIVFVPLLVVLCGIVYGIRRRKK